jgi:5'-3' exonuclease
MGVPSFYKWLAINKDKYKCKNVIINEFVDKPDIIDYLMIDGNGSFHMCLKYIIDEFKDGNKNNRIKNVNNPRIEIIEQTIKSFYELIDYMILVLNCKNVFIAIDGVAPIAKITQQRQRRYKYLFDSKMKNETSEILNAKFTINKNKINEPDIPIRSIELTPGTDIMETIHLAIKKYVKLYNNNNIKIMYSSYHSEGEGEHKILQYIKKNISIDKTIVIYGLDADLIFLSLSVGNSYNMYIMREAQIFNNEEINLTETLTYNYIDVKKLHELIQNIGISTNDFILLCFLAGNDFLPRLISIDIKKYGLNKIIDTFLKTFEHQIKEKNSILVKESNENNEKIFKINHQSFLYFLKKLQWTEKYLWSNINRKKVNDKTDNNKIMNDFISGKSENIDFINKIEFSSKEEYYNYYFGTSSININNNDIKVMVNNYIIGIEWCFQYYFNKCISWTWSYNYPIAPLIEDLINFYPNQIIIKKSNRTLKPVEQLLIAIPTDTYKYVIEESIINKFKNNLEIGYMMPLNYTVDVNKESLYWKCSVKIPNEYYDFIKNVHLLDINNKKNEISDKLYSNF